MDWEVSLMMWYWPGFMACPTTLASPPEIALIVRAKVQGQPTLVDRQDFCQSFIFSAGAACELRMTAKLRSDSVACSSEKYRRRGPTLFG